MLWDTDAAYSKIILSSYILSANKEISRKSGGGEWPNKLYIYDSSVWKYNKKKNLSRRKAKKSLSELHRGIQVVTNDWKEFNSWMGGIENRKPEVLALENKLRDNLTTIHFYFARNRTPSPSVIAIIWERFVFPRMAIALRSNGTGMFVKAVSTGGSVIS